MIGNRDDLKVALTTLRRNAGSTIRDIATRADVPRATDAWTRALATGDS